MTQEEYITLFRGLALLVDKALLGAEQIEVTQREQYLSRVVEAIETLASMRGDSSIFMDSRPEGLSANGLQSEMYRTEEGLRTRLLALGYQYPQR